ncbi:hypothetical protein [Streptococcus porcinus]|uniref:BioF2-like acetyltransferase domain-containing protein n=1 Tax=Streptococcus porcinus TaxID=1340 RepID=A0A4V0GZJ4_STRPO|nr:hypothetical protein [Streptococcus porcinus]VTT42110.1 Uncharacterised protein [Streptococcus porcinus]VTT43553.1 Uncharacterised protein [Streptococcus porcinus]
MSHFSRSLQALSQIYSSQALIKNLTIPIEILEIETMANSENETVGLTSLDIKNSLVTSSQNATVEMTNSENGNVDITSSVNEKMQFNNGEVKSTSLKLPCSVNHQAQDNAWTVSLKSMIVGAGYDELPKLKGISKVVTKLLIKVLEHFIDCFKMDDIIGLDNACLTTSLMSKEMLALDPEALFTKASQAYPNSTLMIRSLNKAHHGSFLEKLEQETTAHLLVNRQIYLIDQPELALKKRDSKRDLKLLEDGRYKFIKLKTDSYAYAEADKDISRNPKSEPDSLFESTSITKCQTHFSDFQSVISLYNQLYLEKYSDSNVQFTPLFIQELVREGAMTVFLMENQAGQACGCVGLIEEEGILTAPLLGYRTELAQSEGLYRRLSIFITQYCMEKGFKQNLSAGAPDFKKNRGAKPTLEYTAVYVDHLPWYRRVAWQLLAWTCQHYYGPMLVRKGL